RPVVSVRELRPDVPEGLALVVHRCLQRAPELRYRSVLALACALGPHAPNGARAVEKIRALGGGARAQAAELSTIDTLGAPTKRLRRAPALAAAGIACLALIGVREILTRQEPAPLAPIATPAPPAVVSALVTPSSPAPVADP